MQSGAVRHPAWPGERRAIAPRPGAAPDAGARSEPDRQLAIADPGVALLCEVKPSAWNTWFERRGSPTSSASSRSSTACRAERRPPRPLDAADLLRQLVYLPQASVLVAETLRDDGRGRGPRPPPVGPGRRLRRARSTSSSVDPRHDADRVTGLLLEELLRSAQQQGLRRRRGARPPRTPPTLGRAGSGTASGRPARASNVGPWRGPGLRRPAGDDRSAPARAGGRAPDRRPTSN